MKRTERVIFCALLCINMFAPEVFALRVIPSGECVGVKLYANAPVVVDTVSVADVSGKETNAAAEAGIRSGDMIIKANGIDIFTNEALADVLDGADGSPVELTVERDGQRITVQAAPVITEDGAKLGLWLRDSTAGLGTITCFVDGKFAALGHGICDVDTGGIIPVGHGIIQQCTINEIVKSSDGSPGAVTGDIDGEILGTITSNTSYGLFGDTDYTPEGTEVETAKISEVRCGDATILADVDGEGVKEYSIEIKRVTRPILGTKDMVIKITDPELTEKTGGIVQGMSGAPILQNGKLVGAVTHVFVNDACSGYAILAEHMLKDIVTAP